MTAYQSTSAISGYHAHVYFDAKTTEKAKVFCKNASELFDVTMGNVHERPVGPHPMYSCQLTCNPTQFSKLLPWLALNRDELIVFCHPDTGNHLADHSKHMIWLGEAQALDLSIFRKETGQ
jgi:aromatic ring-cleaving dioxygenase